MTLLLLGVYALLAWGVVYALCKAAGKKPPTPPTFHCGPILVLAAVFLGWLLGKV